MAGVPAVRSKGVNYGNGCIIEIDHPRKQITPLE